MGKIQIVPSKYTTYELQDGSLAIDLDNEMTIQEMVTALEIIEANYSTYNIIVGVFNGQFGVIVSHD